MHGQMMTHQVSSDDRRFIHDLENHALEPGQFDHRAHVRAAYVYFVGNDPDSAAARMRDTLRGFLFSPRAREEFVEPDIDPIPRHE